MPLLQERLQKHHQLLQNDVVDFSLHPFRLFRYFRRRERKRRDFKVQHIAKYLLKHECLFGETMQQNWLACLPTYLR